MICESPQVRGANKGKTATGSHAGYMRHRNSGEPPCDPCRIGHNAWKQEVYRTRPQYQDKQGKWSRNRRLTQYGITQDDYDNMLAAQGGVCKICGTDDPQKGTRFHVDHDHACCPGTGKCCGKCIRGLLCMRCNMAIGLFKDDYTVMQAALEYLRGSGRDD